nr:vacuolar protein sorting-associated protein 52 [Quercus suber]
MQAQVSSKAGTTAGVLGAYTENTKEIIMSVWLERFSGHTNQSGQSMSSGSNSTSNTPNRFPSPVPRRSVQLGPSTIPRRPGLTPRTSSLSAASFGTSTESLPYTARVPNGSSLKSELGGSHTSASSNPVHLLESILGPLTIEHESESTNDKVYLQEKVQDFEFGGLSLEDFAASAVSAQQEQEHTLVIEDFEKEKEKFDDLHNSVAEADKVLNSVETYLSHFQAELAAVSSEIEHLQDRSIALNNKLHNRRAVDKILGPEVEAFAIPPSVVRKITEGAVDDAWVKALEELEKRSKAIDAKLKDGKDVQASQDIRPFVEDVSTKAVERIRDYVVAQIKALRSPNINAQVIQQNSFRRYRDVFGFLARRQPQLAGEISQAYINTMRWYYSSHFARYKLAIDKLDVNVIDQTDAIGSEPVAKRGAKVNATPDVFSLGRRSEILHRGMSTALPAFAAEEDKGTHFLETPFRAFNIALIDNASSEYSFLAEFFRLQPFQTTNRTFTSVFSSSFELGQNLTKQLIENTADALGVLICVRLTAHFAFELQRRKVPAADGYINGTNMLLWPRFQQIIDTYCESIRKVTASLPGRPSGTALLLTSNTSTTQTTAPHPLTQRFANLTQGILSLSSEAEDDEPVSHSLGRLRAEFETFLVKMSKGIAEAKKRERFMYNNYSLICTIIADVEGKLAEELRHYFEGLRDALGLDS